MLKFYKNVLIFTTNGTYIFNSKCCENYIYYINKVTAGSQEAVYGSDVESYKINVKFYNKGPPGVFSQWRVLICK